MLQGKNLVQLAEELQRRSGAKKDLVADTRSIELTNLEGQVSLNVGNRSFGITQHTHRQLGTHLNIPAKYYDRMLKEAPELLSRNANHWLHNGVKRRMIRTLDGNARAFLSDRYRRIDNEDIAEVVIPALMEGGSQIASCEVTDSKLYIKALFPKTEGEVGLNDQVQAGVVITNSEIGLGSLSVQPLVYRLVCLNGMICPDAGLKRYHVGRKVGDGADVATLFRDETLQADDKALMLKLRDVVNAASDQDAFNLLIEKMRTAAQGEVVLNPINSVEVLAKNTGLNEREQTSVLENLIRGQDYTRWGMLNAVTAVANTHDSYDRATELEALGGQILDLDRRSWSEIAEAA